MQIRSQLESHDIHFPLLPGPDLKLTANHSGLFYSLFGDAPENYHLNVAQGIATQEAARQINRWYEDQLIKSIKRSSFKSTIFSGEAILLLSSAAISRLKSFLTVHFGEECSIKVIFYLRPPNDWFASLVQQWVRGGAVLDEIKGTHFPNIRARLEPFVATFGANNVLIGKFEDAISYPGGPTAHFLSYINCDVDTTDISNRVENRGLCAEAVYLLSALNKMRRTIPGDTDAKSPHIPLEAFFNIKGTKFVLPKDLEEAAWNSAQESLDWISLTFGVALYKKCVHHEPQTAMWQEDALQSIAHLLANKDVSFQNP
jgi:hypothetical protein